MILSAQHTRVLIWLARYKYLCLEQIHTHLFVGKSRRNTEIALQRIEQKGFIKRAKLPRTQNLNFGPLCYLTKEGLELIREEQQLDNRSYIKYSVTKPMTSINAYYHRYQLTNFFIKLDSDIRFVPNIQLKMVLTEAGTKEVGKKRVIETKLIKGKISIIPDMIFVLRNTQTHKEAVFMVEIDTGKEAIGGQFQTIPKGSLLYKYQIYEKFLQSPDWQKQLETTAKTFQVLTITEQENHLQTLMNRTNEKMKYPNYFLGSTLGLVQEGNVFIKEIWMNESQMKKLL